MIALAIIVAVVAVMSILAIVLPAIRSRNESPKPKDRFDWRLPLYFIPGAIVVIGLLMLCSPYGFLVYYISAPIICWIGILLLLDAVIRKRPRGFLPILLTLVTFIAPFRTFFKNEDELRASLRWLVWSHYLKAEVLAQPAPANGELKHMEWEMTGFAGVANNTVYLVFDPADSLSSAHSPGKFNGIPCKVPLVRRLESSWYSVWFYTDEAWGDCSSSGPGQR
jgi:hypothetical protein